MICGVRLIQRKSSPLHNPFPWWGWLGVALGIAAWKLAWTRYEWMSAFQPFIFSPLWLAYILVVNALTVRRSGHCLLTHRPAYFFSLFPVSAVFWWFFEYLNPDFAFDRGCGVARFSSESDCESAGSTQSSTVEHFTIACSRKDCRSAPPANAISGLNRFVQNWRYEGAENMTPMQYFAIATLHFSTVLPAVTSTFAWLEIGLGGSSKSLLASTGMRAKAPAGVALVFAGASLAGVGVYPNLLFPLLWIAPLFLVLRKIRVYPKMFAA